MDSKKLATAITISKSREVKYPSASRIIDEADKNFSEIAMASIERVMKDYHLEDKSPREIEWFLQGLSMGLIGSDSIRR